jgi:hypothetical protein
VTKLDSFEASIGRTFEDERTNPCTLLLLGPGVSFENLSPSR